MDMRPTLLLLPGLLCDERLWRDQVAGLADEADIAIAELTQDDSIGGMAARAIAMLDARGTQDFAVCGLSMGGYVAIEVWRQATARVTRLALLDTSARADTEAQTRRRRGLMALTRTGQFKGVTPRLLPSLIHPDRLGTPLADEVRAMAERIGREAFLRQQQAIMTRVDSRGDLARVAVPTLVGVGAEDILTPPELAEEMAALIPGATLRRFTGSGHLPTMEVPELVNAALRDWLAPTGHGFP
ncbi:alpha/beta fold hydrolase [Plastoroseomonas arctica]|uniref:Alpha/beta fold hydrolase n=1 Tax=Plastoroseomonas arctica TaxID=1509237 RepID=A0AAF1K497_9PROT|nr:alpha/beta fold hydrolase [Plastoroseomonas arctica]MBR0656448.1 alpha/beta fold hydrolase [Plastoroseomonas arctica]